MIKPKLTVVSPNPLVKSVTKLYYVLTYLERMDKDSNLITLVKRMISDKLENLLLEFRTTTLDD